MSDSDHTCERCNATMCVEYGDEPTPHCHDCAHDLVDELHAKLDNAAAYYAARAETYAKNLRPGEDPRPHKLREYMLRGRP